MKTLQIGDRLFDPDEIDHCELAGLNMFVYYRMPGFVSSVRFTSYDAAAIEFYSLPEEICKKIRRNLH